MEIKKYEGRCRKIGNKWTHDKDPRITRCGKFIRKFRIDELPQICSVIAGDMVLLAQGQGKLKQKKSIKELSQIMK